MKNPSDKADNSVPYCVRVHYCTCVLMCPVCECEGGERGGENAELSVFEWAHYSAQREALYSAQAAYPTIEVTKQLCTA